jgi:hypothetical protein
MNSPFEIQIIQRRKNLSNWMVDQKRRINLRFPIIDFHSDHWPIRTLYGTDQADWYFTESFASLAEKDASYSDALRCIVAEMILTGKPKSIDHGIRPFRWLTRTAPHCLFDLTLQHLRQIETDCLCHVREGFRSSTPISGKPNFPCPLVQ